YTPVGLDWFAPNAEEFWLENDPPPNWVGLALANDQRLREFAGNAIDSINNYFNNELATNQKFDKTQLLTPTHVETFVQGMIEYRNRLRQHFLGAVHDGADLPDGIQKRMKMLGWVAWTASVKPPPKPSAPQPPGPKTGWTSAKPSNTSN